MRLMRTIPPLKAVERCARLARRHTSSVPPQAREKWNHLDQRFSSSDQMVSREFEKANTFLGCLKTPRRKAEEFCGAYCSREERLFQFQAFILNAQVLADCVTQDSTVVMDSQSEDEFFLTKSHITALLSSENPSDSKPTRDLSKLPDSARYLIVPVPP